MSHDPSPIPLPPGVTEDDILGLIEGTLVGDRARGVAAAVQQNAAWRELVAGMRADRSVLAASDRVRAPEGLLSGIDLRAEPATEFESLQPAPTFKISPQAAPVRWGGWAVAAVFLLLIGGGFFMLPKFGSARSGLLKRPEVKRDLAAAGSTTTAEARSAEVVPLTAPPVETAAAISDGVQGEMDAAVSTQAVASITDAIALARDGRLAIVIEGGRARDATITTSRSRAVALRGWALDAAVHDEQIRSVSTLLAAAPSTSSGVDELGRIIMAVEAAPDFVGPPSDVIRGSTPETPQVFSLEVLASSRSLDAAKASLERQMGGSARFEALDEPIPASMPEDPRDIFWWKRAPSEWTPRVTVPVVVTPKR